MSIKCYKYDGYSFELDAENLQNASNEVSGVDRIDNPITGADFASELHRLAPLMSVLLKSPDIGSGNDKALSQLLTSVSGSIIEKNVRVINEKDFVADFEKNRQEPADKIVSEKEKEDTPESKIKTVEKPPLEGRELRVSTSETIFDDKRKNLKSPRALSVYKFFTPAIVVSASNDKAKAEKFDGQYVQNFYKFRDVVEGIAKNVALASQAPAAPAAPKAQDILEGDPLSYDLLQPSDVAIDILRMRSDIAEFVVHAKKDWAKEALKTQTAGKGIVKLASALEGWCERATINVENYYGAAAGEQHTANLELLTNISELNDILADNIPVKDPDGNKLTRDGDLTIASMLVRYEVFAKIFKDCNKVVKDTAEYKAYEASSNDLHTLVSKNLTKKFVVGGPGSAEFVADQALSEEFLHRGVNKGIKPAPTPTPAATSTSTPAAAPASGSTSLKDVREALVNAKKSYVQRSKDISVEPSEHLDESKVWIPGLDDVTDALNAELKDYIANVKTVEDFYTRSVVVKPSDDKSSSAFVLPDGVAEVSITYGKDKIAFTNAQDIIKWKDNTIEGLLKKMSDARAQASDVAGHVADIACIRRNSIVKKDETNLAEAIGQHKNLPKDIKTQLAHLKNGEEAKEPAKAAEEGAATATAPAPAAAPEASTKLTDDEKVTKIKELEDKIALDKQEKQSKAEVVKDSFAWNKANASTSDVANKAVNDFQVMKESYVSSFDRIKQNVDTSLSLKTIRSVDELVKADNERAENVREFETLAGYRKVSQAVVEEARVGEEVVRVSFSGTAADHFGSYEKLDGANRKLADIYVNLAKDQASVVAKANQEVLKVQLGLATDKPKLVASIKEEARAKITTITENADKKIKGIEEDLRTSIDRKVGISESSKQALSKKTVDAKVGYVKRSAQLGRENIEGNTKELLGILKVERDEAANSRDEGLVLVSAGNYDKDEKDVEFGKIRTKFQETKAVHDEQEREIKVLAKNAKQDVDKQVDVFKVELKKALDKGSSTEGCFQKFFNMLKKFMSGVAALFKNLSNKIKAKFPKSEPLTITTARNEINLALQKIIAFEVDPSAEQIKEVKLSKEALSFVAKGLVKIDNDLLTQALNSVGLVKVASLQSKVKELEGNKDKSDTLDANLNTFIDAAFALSDPANAPAAVAAPAEGTEPANTEPAKVATKPAEAMSKELYGHVKAKIENGLIILTNDNKLNRDHVVGLSQKMLFLAQSDKGTVSKALSKQLKNCIKLSREHRNKKIVASILKDFFSTGDNTVVTGYEYDNLSDADIADIKSGLSGIVANDALELKDFAQNILDVIEVCGYNAESRYKLVKMLAEVVEGVSNNEVLKFELNAWVIELRVAVLLEKVGDSLTEGGLSLTRGDYILSAEESSLIRKHLASDPKGQLDYMKNKLQAIKDHANYNGLNPIVKNVLNKGLGIISLNKDGSSVAPRYDEDSVAKGLLASQATYTQKMIDHDTVISEAESIVAQVNSDGPTTLPVPDHFPVSLRELVGKYNADKATFKDELSLALQKFIDEKKAEKVSDQMILTGISSWFNHLEANKDFLEDMFKSSMGDASKSAHMASTSLDGINKSLVTAVGGWRSNISYLLQANFIAEYYDYDIYKDVFDGALGTLFVDMKDYAAFETLINSDSFKLNAEFTTALKDQVAFSRNTKLAAALAEEGKTQTKGKTQTQPEKQIVLSNDVIKALQELHDHEDVTKDLVDVVKDLALQGKIANMEALALQGVYPIVVFGNHFKEHYNEFTRQGKGSALKFIEHRLDMVKTLNFATNHSGLKDASDRDFRKKFVSDLSKAIADEEFGIQKVEDLLQVGVPTSSNVECNSILTDATKMYWNTMLNSTKPEDIKKVSDLLLDEESESFISYLWPTVVGLSKNYAYDIDSPGILTAFDKITASTNKLDFVTMFSEVAKICFVSNVSAINIQELLKARISEADAKGHAAGSPVYNGLKLLQFAVAGHMEQIAKKIAEEREKDPSEANAKQAPASSIKEILKKANNYNALYALANHDSNITNTADSITKIEKEIQKAEQDATDANTAKASANKAGDSATSPQDIAATAAAITTTTAAAVAAAVKVAGLKGKLDETKDRLVRFKSVKNNPDDSVKSLQKAESAFLVDITNLIVKGDIENIELKITPSNSSMTTVAKAYNALSTLIHKNAINDPSAFVETMSNFINMVVASSDLDLKSKNIVLEALIAHCQIATSIAAVSSKDNSAYKASISSVLGAARTAHYTQNKALQLPKLEEAKNKFTSFVSSNNIGLTSDLVQTLVFELSSVRIKLGDKDVNQYFQAAFKKIVADLEIKYPHFLGNEKFKALKAKIDKDFTNEAIAGFTDYGAYTNWNGFADLEIVREEFKSIDVAVESLSANIVALRGSGVEQNKLIQEANKYLNSKQYDLAKLQECLGHVKELQKSVDESVVIAGELDALIATIDADYADIAVVKSIREYVTNNQHINNKEGTVDLQTLKESLVTLEAQVKMFEEISSITAEVDTIVASISAEHTALAANAVITAAKEYITQKKYISTTDNTVSLADLKDQLVAVRKEKVLFDAIVATEVEIKSYPAEDLPPAAKTQLLTASKGIKSSEDLVKIKTDLSGRLHETRSASHNKFLVLVIKDKISKAIAVYNKILMKEATAGKKTPAETTALLSRIKGSDITVLQGIYTEVEAKILAKNETTDVDITREIDVLVQKINAIEMPASLKLDLIQKTEIAKRSVDKAFLVKLTDDVNVYEDRSDEYVAINAADQSLDAISSVQKELKSVTDLVSYNALLDVGLFINNLKDKSGGFAEIINNEGSAVIAELNKGVKLINSHVNDPAGFLATIVLPENLVNAMRVYGGAKEIQAAGFITLSKAILADTRFPGDVTAELQDISEIVQVLNKLTSSAPNIVEFQEAVKKINDSNGNIAEAVKGARDVMAVYAEIDGFKALLKTDDFANIGKSDGQALLLNRMLPSFESQANVTMAISTFPAALALIKGIKDGLSSIGISAPEPLIEMFALSLQSEEGMEALTKISQTLDPYAKGLVARAHKDAVYKSNKESINRALSEIKDQESFAASSGALERHSALFANLGIMATLTTDTPPPPAGGVRPKVGVPPLPPLLPAKEGGDKAPEGDAPAATPKGDDDDKTLKVTEGDAPQVTDGDAPPATSLAKAASAEDLTKLETDKKGVTPGGDGGRG